MEHLFKLCSLVIIYLFKGTRLTLRSVCLGGIMLRIMLKTVMIFEITIKSYPVLPVWLSAQCHLDAVQPVSEQEPGATSDSSSTAASSPGAPPAPRWQGGSRRHLLGRVLLDRWLQWEDRGGGAGWPRAPSSTAAGIWGALYCGMWWFCLGQKYSCVLTNLYKIYQWRL